MDCGLSAARQEFEAPRNMCDRNMRNRRAGRQRIKLTEARHRNVEYDRCVYVYLFYRHIFASIGAISIHIVRFFNTKCEVLQTRIICGSVNETETQTNGGPKIRESAHL